MITANLRYLVCGFAAGAIATSPAHAAETSPWQSDSYSAIRLIAGEHFADARWGAGIEIRLDPGWKTYWRYPGDSGVPPRFDFTQSTNVRSVKLLWPAPHRFTDESGNSIGYKDDVIFPIEITPQDPKKPVTLRLTLDYAVCEKLCVPAKGNAELAVSQAAIPTTGLALSAAAERVPKRAEVGDGATVGIRAVRRETRDGHDRVIVDVAAPAADPVELFAEGPTPDWALPLPESVSAAPAGLRRFAFELDGLPPGAKADGAVLTLTLVAGDHALEVNAKLD
jgi:DsbC/DsbD-like thiol-disulfide interchange protein